MKLFAALISTLGVSTKTNDKLEALVNYFAQADDKDKVWVIAIFSGRRPRRTVSTSLLQEWCLAATGIPAWLFEESYHTVGDLAETLALLMPEGRDESMSRPLYYYLDQLISLEKADDETRSRFVLSSWQQMTRSEMFVFNKLITGNFRIGVSQKMIVNALAKTVGMEPSVIAHRIIGNWDPREISFDALLSKEASDIDHSKPYPFYLAYALEDEPASLGDPAEWLAEWKWDGIRGEIIKRDGKLFVWSRGEELMTEKFPEYSPLEAALPDGTALDGEIICLVTDEKQAIGFQPLPFAALQTRIGRKTISKKQLAEAPVGFIAYDILEYEGVDVREQTQAQRRLLLESVISRTPQPFLKLSPVISFEDWQNLAGIRQQARALGSEGIMLKRKNAVYQVGRKRGDWWKWKIDPLTIDAVMIYAQKGHGRRSNLYTDYTFAVRDGDKLVSFAKAYSGLTDKEFNEVDYFVKRNSIEKFGPVRTVKPELVFEIAFEGIAASNRHKSGVALRFPRMSRWRKDKKADEINTLDDLKLMLEQYGK